MQSKIVEAQKILSQKNSNPNKAVKLLTPLVQGELTPWQAYHLYGVAMLKKRDFSRALDYLKRAIYSGSEDSATYHGLAVAAFNMKKFQESETFAKKAVEIKGDHFDAWMMLGDSRRELRKLNESLLSYQRCNQINPKSVEVAYKIAQIYNEQGFVGKAQEMYDIAIRMDQKHLGAINEKAKILTGQRRFEEALETIESGLNYEPDNIALQATCAEMKKEMGEYTQALSIYEVILKNYPEYGGIRVNYANILQDLGRFDEAEENYLQANKDFPALMESFSNYLFVQHYNPSKSKEEIFEAHKKWDSIYAPENPERPNPENRDKERALRVGLISGGFRKHPVGWMITPALEKLDQSGFDLYFYSNFNQVDEITKRLHAVSRKWHMISGLDDEQLNQLIRQDKIDILIDLSGHAAQSRLRTVAMEPAPIIVKWVGGLINTTGLKAIDFLISDSIETPEGVEPFYLEKLVRMPDDYICFNAPDYTPLVSESPFKMNGYITFGCFNNPIKVNEEIMKYWAEIMKKVPNSRLFLKSKQYGNKIYVERIQMIMNEYGIEADRLIFEGLSPHAELLETYNRVDIALDPWPYSGGLTTCEALWMGVPVITIPGETFAGRHSASHLHNAGCAEWIAENWDEYVSKTVNLANDGEKLSQIRAGLREKIAASPLCDSDRYAFHLKEALRSMWYQRVEGYEKGLSSNEWQKHILIKPVENLMLTGNVKRQGKPEMDSNLLEMTITNTEKKNNGSVSYPANGLAKKDDPSENPTDTFIRHIMDEEIVVYTPDSKKSLTSYVLEEQGTWYEDEMKLFRGYIRPGMNIIDIGAGVGVYTLSAAKTTGPGGKVVAFEPSSILYKCLKKNILENELSNVEIIDLAVKDEVGNDQFHSSDEVPEFGKLDRNGELEVKTTTIDAWWRLNKNPKVDLIKIDVNGHELQVLKGAENLLSKNSPLLLIAVSNSKGQIGVINNYLNSTDYELYQYISRLKLLVRYESEQEPDVYLNNLVAVKKDLVASLIDQGLIFDESVEIEKPANNTWLKVFNEFQWSSDKLPAWESALNQVEAVYYKRALNYISIAQECNIESDQKNRSVKAKYLLGAAQLMIELYNGGINQNISISLSLSRVLNDLGKREQAVSVLKNVIEQQQKNGNPTNGDEFPFFLPHYTQDVSEIKTDYDMWLMVRIVEAWLLLKDQSSYFSGNSELRMMHLMEGNPEAGDEILRRVKTSLLYRSSNENSGHDGEVRVSIQKTEKILEFSASSKLQDAITDFNSELNGKKMAFIPNGHGGNYGVVQRLQNQMFRHLRHMGIDAEWSVQNLNAKPDLNEVSNYILNNRENSVYFTGIYWYDLSVNLRNGTSKNLFDHLDIPVISLIGDHPYTSFMQSRVNGSSEKGLMLSNWKSLADEFRFLKPARYHVKSLNKTVSEIETIGPDWNHNRHYIPHHNRELDLLIPLGLVKFSEQKEDKLLQDSKSAGSEYHKFTKTVLGEALTEYDHSILDIAKKVHQNFFGSEWEVQNEWDEHTLKLTQIIGQIDWIIRQKRRSEMLNALLKSKEIREMKLAITLPEEYKSMLPKEIEQLDLSFLGIVPGQKLEELYGTSRFILHSNLTFPDAIHERVRMASAMGTAIITDPSPGLTLFNSDQNSLLIRSYGESYEKIDFSVGASEMIGRRAYKAAKNKADADSYLIAQLENWTEYLKDR